MGMGRLHATFDEDSRSIEHRAGTILLRKPVSNSYVKLDDFVGNISAGRDRPRICPPRSCKESLARESKQTGRKIEFTGWRLYPDSGPSRRK